MKIYGYSLNIFFFLLAQKRTLVFALFFAQPLCVYMYIYLKRKLTEISLLKVQTDLSFI